MNDFAIKVLTAKLGQTHIFSIGQAGYIIKSSSGQIIGIDLYLSDCVERIEGHVGFKRLLPKLFSPLDIIFDAIICTHAHVDHFDFDSIPSLLANCQTQLFCSEGCRNLTKSLYLSYHSKRINYVKPGDFATVGDFYIKFVNCDHGKSAPDAVGVVVSTDGRLIYDEISQNLDILIAPINGAFGNMNEVECTKLAGLLKPKITIPCHYGMFASHHGDVGKFYEVMRGNNLPFLIMQQGEQYTLIDN